VGLGLSIAVLAWDGASDGVAVAAEAVDDVPFAEGVKLQLADRVDDGDGVAVAEGVGAGVTSVSVPTATRSTWPGLVRVPRYSDPLFSSPGNELTGDVCSASVDAGVPGKGAARGSRSRVLGVPPVPTYSASPPASTTAAYRAPRPHDTAMSVTTPSDRRTRTMCRPASGFAPTCRKPRPASTATEGRL
jgi:hypothetical protein